MSTCLLRMRAAIAALALLLPASALAGATADSSDYWLVPGVKWSSVTPVPLTPGEGLTLRLRGLFPYDCGVIADTLVVGSHVTFTMRPSGIACGDTARVWMRDFPIGAFTYGLHTVTVTRTLIDEEGSSEVREGSFDIFVGAPPPPPPTCALFNYVTTYPNPLNDGSPASVLVHGCFPHPCGAVVGTALLGPLHVQVTIQEEACEDSVQNWEAPFTLGMLPAGRHNLLIDVRNASNPDVSETFGVWLDVLDATPDPPGDSLYASSPNPFATETQFGLGVREAGEVEVGIFDVQGRAVRRIFQGAVEAGTRKFSWNGRRDDGSRAEPGLYFYRFSRGGVAKSRRIVLLPNP